MIIKQTVTVIFMSFFLFHNNVYAAGSTIAEDFSLDKSMCEDMVDAAKKADQTRVLELAEAVLKLSEAQRRDNSMAIDRFRPKIRAAKKAAKLSDYQTAIANLEEAIRLMKPAEARWDGGN